MSCTTLNIGSVGPSHTVGRRSTGQHPATDAPTQANDPTILASEKFMCLKRRTIPTGSQLLVEDLAELVADILDLRLLQPRVEQVHELLLTAEPHLPDFA